MQKDEYLHRRGNLLRTGYIESLLSDVAASDLKWGDTTQTSLRCR